MGRLGRPRPAGVVMAPVSAPVQLVSLTTPTANRKETDMEIEERMEKIEDAHRAMAAQHMALQQICLVMLPLISAPEPLIRNVLLLAYDNLTECMDNNGIDGIYQQDARAKIDALIAVILGAANTHDRAPKI